MPASSAKAMGLGPLARILLVLALAVPVVSLGPGEARAEGDLEVAAKVTYTVEAESGVLRVAIEYTLTNLKPSTTSGNVTTRYYYDRYALVIPDEATDLIATGQSGSLRVTDEVAELEDGSEGRVATIHMGSIFYRQSRTFTFSFGIPGGEPRSAAGVRVNPAYTAFWAGAFGDPDKSQVEIRLPAGFEVSTYGDFVERTDTDAEIILSEDDIADPYEWGVFVTGRRDDALDATTVDLGGLEIEVKAWPGDTLWSDRVADVAARGMPELQSMVGLEYHVDQLAFLETLDPALVGYAGWYLVGEHRIEMSEHLDDHVILHELAHLWFNEDLFIDRWINEGLADTFAAEAVIAIDGESDDAYSRALIPVTSLSIAVPLNDWDLPASSDADDDEIRRREDYGYNASFFVVRALFEEIGPEGLSVVLKTASADEIAYQGNGTPESVDPLDSWRRLLDILQEVAGSDEAEELFRTYVVAERDFDRLDDRAEARDAYHAHRAAAGGWDTPLALREPLAEWEFDDALAAIDAASAVLELSSRLQALAAGLGLDAPDSVELAYEAATDLGGLDDASALAGLQLEALELVSEARAAVDGQRGFFDRIGLIGQNPELEWSEAAEAFEAEDLEGARVEAREAIDMLANAAGVGRRRVLFAGAGFVGFALVTTGGVWLIARRRRPRSEGGDAGSGLKVDASDGDGSAPLP
ncbi:MAG TPA: hypothetical protein VK960_10685 [Acidimicrobiia bacterium]|nr:hypothetical protein [Acidimicrobiia bacterium]